MSASVPRPLATSACMLSSALRLTGFTMEVRIERSDDFPIRGPGLAAVDEMRTLGLVIGVGRRDRLPILGPTAQGLKRDRGGREQQFAQMGATLHPTDAFLHRASPARAYFPADQPFERRRDAKTGRVRR